MRCHTHHSHDRHEDREVTVNGIYEQRTHQHSALSHCIMTKPFLSSWVLTFRYLYIHLVCVSLLQTFWWQVRLALDSDGKVKVYNILTLSLNSMSGFPLRKHWPSSSLLFVLTCALPLIYGNHCPSLYVDLTKNSAVPH